MVSSNRRIELDVKKLANSAFKVDFVNDSLRELSVEFPGPGDTPYDGGIWSVRVELPNDYPYSSPSVAFKTRMFHPNVDEDTGSVCLDVINQTWTPIFGLVNIFESFLPQLLAYPNAADPLNRRAAAIWNRSSADYQREVKKYVSRYATKTLPVPNDGVVERTVSSKGTEDSDSDMSSLDEFSDEDS